MTAISFYSIKWNDSSGWDVVKKTFSNSKMSIFSDTLKNNHYSDRKTAGAAAQQLAELNKLSYTPEDASVITVARFFDGYLPFELTPSGSVISRGTYTSLDLESTIEKAKSIAKTSKLIFVSPIKESEEKENSKLTPTPPSTAVSRSTNNFSSTTSTITSSNLPVSPSAESLKQEELEKVESLKKTKNEMLLQFEGINDQVDKHTTKHKNLLTSLNKLFDDLPETIRNHHEANKLKTLLSQSMEDVITLDNNLSETKEAIKRFRDLLKEEQEIIEDRNAQTFKQLKKPLIGMETNIIASQLISKQKQNVSISDKLMTSIEQICSIFKTITSPIARPRR